MTEQQKVALDNPTKRYQHSFTTITENQRALVIDCSMDELNCEVIDCDGGIFTNMLIADNPTVHLALFGSGDNLDQWPFTMMVTVGPEGKTWAPACIREFHTVSETIEAMVTMGAILRAVAHTVTPQREWPEKLSNEWAFTTVEHAVDYIHDYGRRTLLGKVDAAAVVDLYAAHKLIGIERRCADCQQPIPDGQPLCNCNTSGDLA